MAVGTETSSRHLFQIGRWCLHLGRSGLRYSYAWGYHPSLRMKWWCWWLPRYRVEVHKRVQ